MIFYFSATGNSKHAAEKIAEKNGDSLFSIARAMKEGNPSCSIEEGEDIGIVTPVYFWGTPSIVDDFFSKVRIQGRGTDHYVYLVLTYGTATGGASSILMSSLAKNFGLSVCAVYAVKMVDTWVPTYDCSDPAKNKAAQEEAENILEETASMIAEKTKGDHNYDRGAWALLWPAAQLLYERARKTSAFSVSGACISCGLCERQCPTDTIRIRNGRPVWQKEKCALCLGCLHRCPAHAISYGKKEKTRQHGQYTNPYAKPDLS